MEFTSATKTCVLLALIFVWGMFTQRTIEGDTPKGDIESEDAQIGRVKDAGRLAWDVIEAIEREHVASPDRRALIEIVTGVLTHIRDKSAHSNAIEEFAACKDIDEFTELLCQHWIAGHRPSWPLEQLPEEITKLSREFGGAFGEIRLTPKKDYAVQEQIRNNRYVGLGVQLGAGKAEGFAQFVRVIPGGPADRGGLKDGTYVHEIDGHSTWNEPVQTVIDWIRGPAGTDVTLKVTDLDPKNEQTVTLTRGVVRFDSVFDKDNTPLSRGTLRSIGLDPIGWIRVQEIKSSTLSELRNAEVKARLENVRVMILDFRGHSTSDNLHQARLIADGLLDGGTLWYRTERGGQPQADTADRECLFRGIPLVILVDQRTGDAHCAIAAALQDAGRATIIGTSPKYDGAVTSSIELPDVPFVLTLPTAKLMRARRDRRWPLEPDHPVGNPNTVAVNRPFWATQTTKMIVPRPQLRLRTKSHTNADDVASGLSPANRGSQTIVKRAEGFRFRLDGAPEPGPMQSDVKITPEPLVKTENIDDVAIRIAKELLAKLPGEVSH